MEVRRLRGSDLESYRDLMLHAYRVAPDAFTSTPEERAAEPDDWWLRRIAHPAGLGYAFGVFLGDDLIGTSAIDYSPKPKTRHKARLLGMFVHESHRGRGAGRAALDIAVDTASARSGIRLITLTYTEGNDPARRLYESAGFRSFGTEPMAIATAGGLRGKVHMWKPVDATC